MREFSRPDAFDLATSLFTSFGYFDDWTRVRNEWILIKNGRTTTFRLHHTLHSGEELMTLLAGAGFADIRVFGNLDGDPYGTEATRLVAVARKPM